MVVNEPLVSVIVPTHNRAALLGRALRSILAQSWRNLELIVVDDASTDDTTHVLATFDDPRLRTIRLDRNQRAAAARNLAVAEARGTLLAFLDDDDVWMPDRLARHVPALLGGPADVGLSICSHVRLMPNRADYIGGASYFAAMRFDRGPFGDFSLVATPGWVMRREHFVRNGGFDVRMRCWDDMEFVLRLSRSCRIEHFDEVLWIQDRLRGMTPGMYDNTRNFPNDIAVLIEKHGPGWRPQLVSRLRYLSALTTANNEGVAAARPALREATRLDRWNLRAWMALGVARFGDPAWQAVATMRRAAARVLPRRTFFHG